MAKIEKLRWRQLIFPSACVVLGLAACVGIAWSLVRTTQWYLSACPGASACGPAGWLIHYWWLIFVPGCIGSAWLLWRLYHRRVRCQTEEH